MWTRTKVAMVDSAEASASTLRGRSILLGDVQKTVTGSMHGGIVQMAKGLKSMDTVEREHLLVLAGLRSNPPSASTALTIKADLHLPWHQLRKLQKWLVCTWNLSGWLGTASKVFPSAQQKKCLWPVWVGLLYFPLLYSSHTLCHLYVICLISMRKQVLNLASGNSQ